MVFREILAALGRLEDGVERLRGEQGAMRRELDGLRRAVDGLEVVEGGSPDAKLQQGIDNLMAFDGRAGKREGL